MKFLGNEEKEVKIFVDIKKKQEKGKKRLSEKSDADASLCDVKFFRET